MLYKVLLDIKTLAADGKKVEEGILPTHIGCTGRVTECQVAVFKRPGSEHGTFLTGIDHRTLYDDRNLYQHIGGKSGKLQGKGTLALGIVVGKFRERGYKKYEIILFHITVLTKKECVGVENGKGFGRGL